MAAHPSGVPSGVIRDILSRLQVKCIVRYKSVSKHWSSLIGSSAFSAAHLRRSSRRPSLLLRHYHQLSASDFSISLFRETPAAAATLQKLNAPFHGGPFRFPQIAGSCNGLICLDISPCFATHLVLWNPATRQIRTLPARRNTPSMGLWKTAIGFGFSPEIDDYKVVRVLYFQGKEDEFPSALVETYSLKTGSWKEILSPDTEVSWVIQEPQRAVNANGSLHWTAMKVGDWSSGRFIVSFDLADEMFSENRLPPPYCTGARFENCFKIMAYQDSIALVVYPQVVTPESSFELWMLREDDGDKEGWSRQFSVKPISRIYVPVEIWKGSHVVMKKLEGYNCDSLTSYDHRIGRNRILNIHPIDSSTDVVNYVESVVSVYGENDENGVAELPH